MSKNVIRHMTVLLMTAALIFSAAIAVSGEDSSVNVDVTGQKEGYSAVLYDNTKGLPTSEANAIAETSEGFIWIGSYGGLIRYDGSSFERIDSTTGIASVVSLYVDSRDRLWIGTNDSGAFVMDKGEYTPFNKESGLRSLSVRAFSEDSDGNIYIATTKGISVIDKDLRLTNIEDEKIADAYVWEINAGSDGKLYCNTNNNEVFTLKGGRLDEYYTAEDLGIADATCVMPDDAEPGKVYIGTEESTVYHGTLSDRLNDRTSVDLAPLAYCKSITPIDGQVWVTTDSGIGIIRDGKPYVLEDLPMTHSVDEMMTDYQGNLWFTSSRQGVMKIVRNRFLDIFEKYGLEPAVVNTTCKHRSLLYIGTDAGLIIIDESTGEKVENDLSAMLSETRIRSIERDSKGNVWISTFSPDCLVRYSDGAIRKFTTADGMPSERIRSVYETKDGRILAACTGGVAVIEGDSVTKVYNDRDGLVNTEILTVAEADNGDLVFGSDGDGLYIIHDGKTLHIGTDDGLTSDVVMRVKKDRSRDILWLVTSNSIGYLDKDNKVTFIHKFPYSNNFDLYQNNKDEMWVLSSNGIYQIPTSEMLENKEISPLFYDTDNGLSCIATANSYSELTRDGDLYIAGSTGVSRVNINTDFDDVASTKVAVPYVEADGKYYYPNAKGIITVPVHPSKLTVYPYVFTYSLINPDVTYYLSGFDKSKSTVKRSDLVPMDYTNLRGGTYSFVIDLSDSMGHDTAEFKTRIIISKAFYEQPLFYIMAAFVLAVIIAVIVKLLMMRQAAAYEKKDKENRQLVREVTEAFAKTIDMKDKYTNGHSTRVADYTVMLAEELGCSEDEIEKYHNIALLHDIGKIGIPEEVLNKPGKLTDEEFAIIKSHSGLGYNALKDISIMPELAIGAGSHHERPDGKGYPKGLKGDEIPRVAQIIAVADTFDAMYSDRPYRRRMNFDKVMEIMKEVSGTQLESDVVEALLRLAEKGKLRAKDDHGGGSTEDINNIHKRQDEEEKKTKTEKARDEEVTE